jgi:hypothetical protein
MSHSSGGWKFKTGLLGCLGSSKVSLPGCKLLTSHCILTQRKKKSWALWPILIRAVANSWRLHSPDLLTSPKPVFKYHHKGIDRFQHMNFGVERAKNIQPLTWCACVCADAFSGAVQPHALIFWGSCDSEVKSLCISAVSPGLEACSADHHCGVSSGL